MIREIVESLELNLEDLEPHIVKAKERKDGNRGLALLEARDLINDAIDVLNDPLFD